MIWIVVELDVVGLLASIQFTTLPFKSMLTESIDNVEIRGKTSSAEVLEKVNVVELIILSFGGREGSREFLGTVISSSIPCSLTTTILHLMNSTDPVHVS